MEYKKLIPFINTESESSSHVIARAEKYIEHGADALFIFVAQLFRTGLCGLSIGIRLVNLCLTCVQNILYGFEKKVFEQQEQQQQVDQLCNNFPWYDGNQI